MKSDCCHEKVYATNSSMRIDADNVNKYKAAIGRTYWYECDQCNKPCDPWICIRCSQYLDEIDHNCQPSKEFRAGIVEGLRLSLHEIMSEKFIEDDPGDWVEYSIKTKIQILIKQYSGE